MRFIALLLGCLVSGPAIAESLRIGVPALATTEDPHRYNFQANNELAMHVFEPLVHRAPDLSLVPALATEWAAESETAWRFTLRGGVRFHDGSPFDSRDVVYSFCRIARAADGAGGFATHLNGVVAVEAASPQSVVIRTEGVQALLPQLLSNIMLIRAPAEFAGKFGGPDHCAGVTGSGAEAPGARDAIVGTGPFRLVSFTPGEVAELSRFDGYWGPAPDWSGLRFQRIPDGAGRSRALMEGEVDLITQVETLTVEALGQRAGIRMLDGPSTAVLYLQMDQRATTPPGVSAGGRNPFADPRVRRAVSLAVGREDLARRVYHGYALPTDQLIPAGLPGHVADLPPPRPDRAAARQLLTEAGYPDGFTTVLATSGHNRRMGEVLAFLLGAVGITVELSLHTGGEFYRLAEQGALPFYLGGYISITGELSNVLEPLLGNPDAGTNMGAANLLKVSVPGLDPLLRQARSTLDPGERRAVLERAARLVHAETAVVPLVLLKGLWAARAGIDFPPRMDGQTFAAEIRRQP